MDLLINLVSGAIGGNAVAKADSKQNLGPVWNTVVGLLGGLLGSGVLNNFITGLVNNTLGGVVGSAACGAIAIYIVNFIKNITTKKI